MPYITVSYEVLLRRYEVLVFKFCLGYLRSHADAEEVTQDVFLRVFHHIKGFEKRAAFKTWLIRIAQNQCSRRYGQTKKRQQLNEALLAGQEEENAGDIEPEQTEDGLAMQALLKLGKDAREILSLRHLSGMSLNEVAKMLELSESAAKMRHLRAVRQFREEYEKIRLL